MESAAVDVRQPLFEAGESGFQISGRGFAFPQVGFHAPGEVFLPGDVAGGILLVVRQPVEGHPAEPPGHARGFVFGGKNRVVVEAGKVFPDAFVVLAQAFVAQAGGNEAFQFPQEGVGSFVQDGGEVRFFEKLDQVAPVRREGDAGAGQGYRIKCGAKLKKVKLNSSE
jgi:hypothetical protein